MSGTVQRHDDLLPALSFWSVSVLVSVLLPHVFLCCSGSCLGAGVGGVIDKNNIIFGLSWRRRRAYLRLMAVLRLYGLCS